jgi:hypothetical protein
MTFVLSKILHEQYMGVRIYRDHSAEQMGKEWIQNHINTDPNLSQEIKDSILNNYVPVISKIDQYGNVVFKEILHDSAGAVIKSRAGYQPIIM